MKVKLWGARGTIAIPRPETHRYGVNTPCVQVDAADAEPLILDEVMGLHWLGDALGKGIFGKGQGSPAHQPHALEPYPGHSFLYAHARARQ